MAKNNEKKSPAERAIELMEKKQQRVRIREDRDVQADDGDNTKYLNHSLRFFNLSTADLKNPQEIQDRITLYFNACAEDDMKPTLMGMCVALGFDRATFYRAREGQFPTIPQETRIILKKASDILNAQMEAYMQNGKINPVSGIFLMKNHYHYTDEQKMVVEAGQNLGDTIDQKKLEEKYKDALPDIEAESEEIN